jgi:hypothetical protein
MQGDSEREMNVEREMKVEVITSSWDVVRTVVSAEGIG